MTLVLGILLAQTAPAIDFDHKGAPVERVVAAMSKAYNEKMLADVTMQKDFIVLALRSETAERARALTAESLNATWTKKNDTWILHRTAEQHRAEYARSLKITTEKIKSIQGRITLPPRVTGKVADEIVQKMIASELDKEGEFVEGMSPELPLGRMFTRLLKDIPAEYYATRLENDQNVFSLRGGNGVWQLPPTAREIILEGLSDQNALRDLLDAKAGSIALPYALGRTAIDLDSLILCLAGRQDIHAIHARYKSEKGHEVQFYYYLPSSEGNEIPPHKWTSKLDAVYTKSPLFAEWMDLLSGNDIESMKKQPSGDLLRLLTDSPNSDHLDLFLNPLVRLAADCSKKSFVVRGPEFGSWFESRVNRVSGAQISHVLNTAFSQYYYDVVERDREVLVVPRDSHSVRGTEYDRVAFAKALKVLRSENALEILEPVSDLLRGLGLQGHAPVVRRLARASRNPFAEEFSRKTLALGLYANLSALQRRIAKNGGLEIGVSALDKFGLSLLQAMMSSDVYSGSSGDIGIRDSDDPLLVDRDGAASLYEVMNTRPDELKVFISAKETRTLYIKANDQAIPSASSLANAGINIVSGPLETEEPFDWSFAWLPEIMIEVSIKTSVGPRRIASTYLQPTVLNTKYVKLEDMSQDFQDRIAQEVKEARRLFGLPPTGGGI